MTNKPKILIIDDELQIRRLLMLTFESNGFTVVASETGNDGLIQAAKTMPDVILLDLGLPDADGSEILHSLREWTKIPIIILSVRSAEEDIIHCIEAGADDYVVKPFRTGELLVRVQLALRHNQFPQHEPLHAFGELMVNLATRIVTVSGCPVKLTATEYALLSLFVQNAGRVLTHDFILHKLWGPEAGEKKEELRVYVAQLRKSIEQDPSRPLHIVTESRIGYRFSAE